MKKILFNQPLFLLLLLLSGRVYGGFSFDRVKDDYFIRNVGQYPSGSQYVLSSGGLRLGFGSGGCLSYVYPDGRVLEVRAEGASPASPLLAEDTGAYRERYYLPGLADVEAFACRRLVYKDLYPGIDWVFYLHNGGLEHEFVLGPGGHFSDIRLSYSAALSHTEDGGVSALGGAYRESLPDVYDAGGQRIPGSYCLEGGGSLRYTLPCSGGNIVIDPEVSWCSYYGGDTAMHETSITSLAYDRHGFVYVCGRTKSSGGIATPGSFQELRGYNPPTGSRFMNAFVAKFDTLGHRIWGTYFYSDTTIEQATSITCDASGNVYVGGMTFGGASGLSTPGVEQEYGGGGGYDGFIVKFDADGRRSWSTYLGGSSGDWVYDLACDPYGSLYAYGQTLSPDRIATPGRHRETLSGTAQDCFLVKYDASTGRRIWGTYFGGSALEVPADLFVGGKEIYITGTTQSDTGIASPGAYRTSFSGGTTDAFLARFDSAGRRIWGTYFGGSAIDEGRGVWGDAEGTEVYMTGHTYSDTGIADAGSWQPLLGGPQDVFVAKFGNSGSRLWSTYLGGEKEEMALGQMALDYRGNLYLCGITFGSLSGIADSNAWQKTFGGGTGDMFVSAFNPFGERIWSSYMGGENIEGTSVYVLQGCVTDGDNLYIASVTQSISGLSTPGSFKPSSPGGLQGFIARIGGLELKPGSVAGLSGADIGGLSLFPSPNRGRFHVSASLGASGRPAELEVLNAVGKVIYRRTVYPSGNRLEYDVDLYPSLPAGVYFMRLAAGDKSERIRFLKEE